MWALAALAVVVVALVEGLLWLGSSAWVLLPPVVLVGLLARGRASRRPARASVLRPVPPRHDGKPVGIIIDQKD